MANDTMSYDKYIPDSLKQDMLSLSRARNLVAMAQSIGIFLLLVGIIGVFFAGLIPVIILSLVTGAAVLCFPFIVRLTGSLGIASNGLVILLFAASVYMVVVNGNTGTASVMAFATVILLSSLLSGAMSGIIWGVISAGTLIGLTIAGNQTSWEQPVIGIVSLAIVWWIGGVFNNTIVNNITRYMSEMGLTRKITNEQANLIDDATRVMTAVAGGDLSQRIAVESEGDLVALKNSINNSLVMLSQVLEQMVNASRQIEQGVSQTAEGAQVLAKGNSNQAASLEQISSSMNEIESRAETNSQNSLQAQSLSNKTSESIRSSLEQMNSLLESMTKISETSASVSKISKVVDEIAFQTNLLALNAAVEAARAGKYGKGFAVVAEEVRNLAARSADAARNTTELIENSIKEVEKGVDNANQTAEQLDSFVETTKKVNDLVGEIAAASEEQSTAVGEINLGLNHVNGVVQQNSSVSEETASVSEELNSQALLLGNLSRHFIFAGRASTEQRCGVSPDIKIAQPPQNQTASVLPLQAEQPIELEQELGGAALPIKTTAVAKSLKAFNPETSKREVVLDDDNFGRY